MNFDYRNILARDIGRTSVPPKGAKWLLIFNGEYFRLHALRGKRARTNHGLESVEEAVAYAVMFCFSADEVPTRDCVQFFNSIEEIPEFYRRDVQDSTILVSHCKVNSRPH